MARQAHNDPQLEEFSRVQEWLRAETERWRVFPCGTFAHCQERQRALQELQQRTRVLKRDLVAYLRARKRRKGSEGSGTWAAVLISALLGIGLWLVMVLGSGCTMVSDNRVFPKFTWYWSHDAKVQRAEREWARTNSAPKTPNTQQRTSNSEQSTVSSPSIQLPAVVPPPPNTNVVWFHAVWDQVPFADSYELAVGSAFSTNVVATGVIFPWAATNALPVLAVRTFVGLQASEWSAPFMMTNYATVWCQTSSNLTAWTELPGTRFTTIASNASAFYREGISNWNNFPPIAQ